MMRAGFEIDDESKEQNEIKNDPNEKNINIDSMRAGKVFVKDELDENNEKELGIEELSPENFTTIELDEDISEQNFHYSFWSSPILWILVIIVILSSVEVVNLSISIFQQNTIMGYVWSIVFLGILSFIIIQIFKEISSVLFLIDAEKNRQKIDKIIKEGSYKSAVEHCKSIINENNSKIISEKFFNSLHPHFSSQEVFALYEQIVLTELDQKAKNIIFKRSIETSLFVAMSPLAWLDMAFAGFRAFKMIREISEVYGFKPGLWGRIKIYRKVINNMIFVGLADLLIDAATDFSANTTTSVMDKIVGKLNSALAMGLAVGFYSTKIGFMTVKSVRPMDISENSKEIFNLTQLRIDLCKYVVKKLTFDRTKTN